eukprot:TRINITY_DN11263_c0_g1_i1.p1 TRINITY_DN11263_c0_g1~~TRINITY_DN11263_c0_g1_i1.p1  ORF type:complete len:129 (+),score=19.05 TRINITY_DN11263_c0_g1_i1:1-387(+)
MGTNTKKTKNQDQNEPLYNIKLQNDHAIDLQQLKLEDSNINIEALQAQLNMKEFQNNPQVLIAYSDLCFLKGMVFRKMASDLLNQQAMNTDNSSKPIKTQGFTVYKPKKVSFLETTEKQVKDEVKEEF